MPLPPVPAEWPDARIVIIDDDDMVRRLLAQSLTASGYENIDDFGVPRDGIDAVVAGGADLVLLDLHMPEMDGIAVLETFVSDLADVPAVIVMTGDGTSEHARQTLALGAADFLRKPVDMTELLLRVRYQLRERRLRLDLSTYSERLEELVAERAGELALLSRVLDEMPIAAAVLDRDLQIRYANARATAMLQGRSVTDALQSFAIEDGAPHDVVRFFRDLHESRPDRLRVLLPTDHGPQRMELEAERLADDVVVVLVHDIEDLEVAKDVLHRSLEAEQIANDELRRLEQMRMNFLSAVSHELRTPLTVVLGLAESLQHHDADVDEALRHELLSRMTANARRLERLLEDLLDLNRLSSGQLTTDRQLWDLAKVVAESVEEVDAVGRTITVEAQPCVAPVDRVQIRRAIANLVRNATVHTPHDTSITVRTVVEGHVARIAVIDDGPGVADEHKQRIFAAFEQGPSAPRHQPGTGIGLSLVAEFIAMHDGRAWVEDTPGGGATFIVELPVVAANSTR